MLDAKAVEFPGFEPEKLVKVVGAKMSEIGIDIERLNCKDKTITYDNYRETVVYSQLILSRDLSISAIKEGLTLDGKL